MAPRKPRRGKHFYYPKLHKNVLAPRDFLANEVQIENHMQHPRYIKKEARTKGEGGLYQNLLKR